MFLPKRAWWWERVGRRGAATVGRLGVQGLGCSAGSGNRAWHASNARGGGRPPRPVAAVPATARRVSEGALTERPPLQGPADELREIDSPSGSSRWPKAIGDWSNVAGPTWPGSPAWSWSRPRPTAPCSTLTWRRAPFSVTLSCSSEAVANLLENAVRYNIPGGRISIRTGSDGDLSWIQVANSATPDLKGDPDELFLPFRSSGRSRSHTGGQRQSRWKTDSSASACDYPGTGTDPDQGTGSAERPRFRT